MLKSGSVQSQNSVASNMKEKDFRAAVILERIGEPIRFQILQYLQQRPRTVSELARHTHRHQTTVSQHLAILRDLHLVRYRNQGHFAFYEIKAKEISEILTRAISLSANSAKSSAL